jgi:hypothetical protein
MRAIEPLKPLWRRASRHWQTFVLLGGVAFGYLVLLVVTGFRWISWWLGGAIAVAMLVVWFRQFRAKGKGGGKAFQGNRETSSDNRLS